MGAGSAGMARLVPVVVAGLVASLLSAAPVASQEVPAEPAAEPEEAVSDKDLRGASPLRADRVVEGEERALSSGRSPADWVVPGASLDRVALGDAGESKSAGESLVAVAATDAADDGRGVTVEVFDQATAARVGASGFVFEVTADPVEPNAGTPTDGAVEKPAESRLLEVSIDYTALKGRFGAGFVDRLRIVQLPACAVVDPLPKDCQVSATRLESTIDRTAGTITARFDPAAEAIVPELPVLPDPPKDDTADEPVEAPVEAQTVEEEGPSSTSTTEPAAVESQAVAATLFGGGGGGGTVMALTSGTNGSEGSYSATPLSQTGTWQVGIGSGSFNYSYPMPLQPGPAGDQPEMTLGYSSASIDGMTGGTNNQASQVGLGWGITEAYIERAYKTCNQDGYELVYEDLCWYSDNAVLHLNGMTSRLFPVGDGSWRMEQDPNWRITRGTTAPNGDNNNEYWRVRTPDGTAYTFGYGETPESGDPATNSAWNVWVLHSAGEGSCTNPYGICNQTWRWNLDRVEDTRGNVTSLYYTRETNKYGLAGGTTGWTYHSGGTLNEIRYGIRSGSSTTAHARLVLESDYRCSELYDPPFGSCPAPTPSNGNSFPDVPNDLICTGTCSVHSPSFFHTKRIYRFVSQVRNGSTWEDVDVVRLNHDWANNGQGQEALWLRYLQRAGYSESGTAAHPTMQFNSNNLLPNRADNYPGGMPQYRLGEIYTDTGTRIVVTYGQPNPCPPTSQYPGEPGQTFTWDFNYHDCFPRWWTPPDNPSGAGFGSFNKYLATKVETFDQVGGSPTMVRRYTYEGDPAWHYDDNILYPAGAAPRTWSDWRGYQKVTTEDGSVLSTQTTRHFNVFRGMHGDRISVGNGGGTKTVNVQTVGGASYVDQQWWRGKMLEERHLDGVGGGTGTVYEYDLINTAFGGGGAAFWAGEKMQTDRRVFSGSGTQYYATETLYNSERLPRKVLEDGWDGTAAHDGEERCTETLYTTPDTGTAWKLDFPKQTTVDEGNCSATVHRRQNFYYDNLATHGATPTAGNVTKIVAERASSSDTVTTLRDYDALGRVIKTTDGAGNVVQTIHTNGVGYPGTTTTRSWLDTTGASYHDTKVAWHPERRTLPVDSWDANNNKTTISYDGMGRALKVLSPTEQATPTQPTWEFSYQLTPGFPSGVSGPIKVTTRQLQSKSPLVYLDSFTFLDGHLRTRQTQTQSPVASKTIVTDTTYTSRGLPDRTTMPEALTATPGAGIITFASSPKNHHLYTFDALERPTLDRFYANGSLRYQTGTSYSHGTVETDPPVGGNTRTITNELNQTSQVGEYNTTTSQWESATYVHNPAGDLTSITDPASNTITYTVDRLGQRTAMTDPDAGNWTYGYDDAGNQQTVTDALGATLWTSYDRLNRPTQRRETNSTGTLLAEWIYDATGEKGLLDKTIRHQTGLFWGDYITDITGYDSRQRPLGTTYTIPGTVGTGLAGTHTFANSYDDTAGTTSHTYPASGGLPAETVTTTFTNLGAPATLTSPLTDGQYVATTSYDNRGRVANRTLGTDTATTDAVYRAYLYDGDQRLTNWIANRNTSGGTALQSDGVFYDDVGNITGRVNGLNLNTECYSYDSRNRLTSAYNVFGACPGTPGTNGTGTDPYNHAYTYSADGRITSRTEQGTTTNYTYLPGRPHAVSSVTGPTNDCDGGNSGNQNYCYDANGNMTRRPSNTAGVSQALIWDSEHRLNRLNDNGNQTRFVYDPDGTRLLRQTPTDTTLYLDGHELTLTGTILTTKRYYDLAGITVAVRDSAGAGSLNYLLGDQLGSTTVSVNSASGAASTQRFLPYGALRSGSITATDRGWIGQTKDGSTGLQYLNARYYDPAIGRFTATDPLADPSRPGSLDSFGYALGNPVTLSDPTGLFTCVPFCTDPFTGDYLNGPMTSAKSPTPQQQAAVDAFVNYGRNPYADPNDPVKTLGTQAALDAGYVIPPVKMSRWERAFSDFIFDIDRCDSFGKQCAIQYAKLGSTLSLALKGTVALGARGAARAAATGATSAADDVVVLGKYPDYINLADDLGARRFSVPDRVWRGMSDSERWAANQRFLDRAITRGSEIRLASPVTPSNLTGYFAREIEYLTKQGYTISRDGLRMIPPG